jgi:hypothetical protein
MSVLGFIALHAVLNRLCPNIGQVTASEFSRFFGYSHSMGLASFARAYDEITNNCSPTFESLREHIQAQYDILGEMLSGPE